MRRKSRSRWILLCLGLNCLSPCNLVVSSSPRGDEPVNPLYEQLRKDGVLIGGEKNIPLSPPILADGLDAAGQREVLQKLVGQRFSVSDFTAKLGTAPHVYSVRKIPAEKSSPPALVVDISFVAHGSIDIIANRDFLENLHKKSKDRRVHILTEKELEKRKLKIESSKDREERYSHGSFIILDRIELQTALHTVVTRQGDTLLAASRLDPRFAADADFPNQWRKIAFDDEGERKLGSPHPYRGAGGYLKATALREPASALFIEYHLVYVEPKEWFNDADPLTPKLPAIIQSEVRTFRRELSAFKK
jgi:hypothetical protein